MEYEWQYIWPSLLPKKWHRDSLSVGQLRVLVWWQIKQLQLQLCRLPIPNTRDLLSRLRCTGAH